MDFGNHMLPQIVKNVNELSIDFGKLEGLIGSYSNLVAVRHELKHYGPSATLDRLFKSSVESIGTTLSIEGLGNVIKKIGAAIKAFFVWIWNKIKAFWNWITGKKQEVVETKQAVAATTEVVALPQDLKVTAVEEPKMNMISAAVGKVKGWLQKVHFSKFVSFKNKGKVLMVKGDIAEMDLAGPSDWKYLHSLIAEIDGDTGLTAEEIQEKLTTNTKQYRVSSKADILNYLSSLEAAISDVEKETKTFEKAIADIEKSYNEIGEDGDAEMLATIKKEIAREKTAYSVCIAVANWYNQFKTDFVKVAPPVYVLHEK